MSGWSERDLDLVGAANGIIVAPDRADHTPGPGSADLGSPSG